MRPGPGADGIGPDDLERLRIQALAKQRELKDKGQWSAGVKAHSEYAGDPVGWMVKFLGIPEETIRWSMLPDYADCYCPRCEQAKHRGAHLWDGDPDPLVRALDLIASGKSVAVSSGTGTGKSMPVDEPVLTPSGWRPIGELRVGDEVIGSQGHAVRVTGVYPQGALPIYELRFVDGAKTRASADHLWAVRSKRDVFRDRPWRVFTTEQLAGMDLDSGAWRIPTPAAVELPERDLPFDPYVMGVLLGDGSFRGGYARVTTADEEIVEAVRSSVGVRVRHIPDSYDYALVGTAGARNPVTTVLRDAGLMEKKSEEKHVPLEYLWASATQRLALLQGLLDTDGTVDRRGIVEFGSSSEALAISVVFLVRSLGGLASMRRRPAYLNGVRHRDQYRVSVRLPGGTAPFRLTRKAARVKMARRTMARTLREITPAGTAECVCIRVDAADSLFVANDFVVTHNTHTLGAAGTLWYLATHEDSIVFSLAPKHELLLKNMWKEVGRLWPKFKRHFPHAELLTGNIRMRDGEGQKEVWAATAFGAGVGADEELAQRLKGFHAPRMLWIFEELPGIPTPLIETIIKTSTDEQNLILGLGNPEHQHDPLAQLGKRSWVTPVRISALDFPNVVTGKSIIPGGRSRFSVERDLADCDGQEDHPHYLSQVRGIAPAQSRRALIQWEWCELAAKRYGDPEYREGGLALGVDPADSPTGDKAAISRWQGACCTEIVTFSAEDASAVAAEVYPEIVDEDKPIDPKYVGIDSVGVGASTVNELKKLGLRIRKIGGSNRPVAQVDWEARYETTEENEDGTIRPTGPLVAETETYANTRSQVLWRLREDLRLGRIALPNDKLLFEELTAIEYEVPGGTGKITVAPKDDIKLQIGRSPNRADAVAYGNFVRPRRPPKGERKGLPEARRVDNRDYGLEKLLEHQAKEERRAIRQRRTENRLRGRR